MIGALRDRWARSSSSLGRRFGRLEARWPWLRFGVDVQRRVSELRGGSLAASVTLLSFLSLFPALLLAVAVVGYLDAAQGDVAARLVRELGLTGEAARTVTQAVDTARDSRAVATLVGLFGTLWAGLGLGGAVRSAYNVAWQVPDRGPQDRAHALAWLCGLGILLAANVTLTTLLASLPGTLAPLIVLAGLLCNAAMWWWTTTVLPNRRIPFRAKLPGIVVGAVAFEVLKIVGGLYVPRLVSRSSAVYGTLGVVFAIIAWLFVFGRVLVYTAAMEVVAWERDHGTQHTVLEVPALPGRFPRRATRAGTRGRG